MNCRSEGEPRRSVPLLGSFVADARERPPRSVRRADFVGAEAQSILEELINREAGGQLSPLVPRRSVARLCTPLRARQVNLVAVSLIRF